MSAPGGSAIDYEAAVEYKASVVEDYVAIAAAALLLYDTAITFGQEVELIWKGKRLVHICLFAANRILGVMFSVSLILFAAHWSRLSSCMGVEIFLMIPLLLLYWVWALFSALRVYAVGRQAWRAATVVFLLALVPFGWQLYAFSVSRFSEVYTVGWACAESDPGISAEAGNISEIVARGSLIVSDIIVLFVTWRNTYDTRKHAATQNIKTSLMTLFLRDGTVFFAAGLAFNTAQIATFIVLNYTTRNGVDLAYFVISASCIIVSRFMLSLRQLSQDELGSTLSDGTLQFAGGTVTVMGGEVDIISAI